MNTETEAEKRMIARCRRGEASAWDELFDRHYDAVGRFIFQLSPDLSREDVEEISQEVMLSVVRNLSSFHAKARLQTWIFRIAVNKTRDFLDKQSAAKRGGGVRARSLQEEHPETGAVLELPCGEPGPDQLLLRAETRELMGQALAELGGVSREIIELRYFGELTNQEIADALELRPKTVSATLCKGLQRLGPIVRRLTAREDAPLAA